MSIGRAADCIPGLSIEGSSQAGTAFHSRPVASAARPQAQRPVDPRVWDAVATALREKVVLEADYRKPTRQGGWRELEPLHVVLFWITEVRWHEKQKLIRVRARAELQPSPFTRCCFVSESRPGRSKKGR